MLGNNERRLLDLVHQQGSLRAGAKQSPIVLTVAGFDPGGGAGVTADLQTFAAHGMYGVAAITALTVQSTLGVEAVWPVDPELLRATLACLETDQPPIGLKIGMLGTALHVEQVCELIDRRKASSEPLLFIVLDPILESSSGACLLEEAGIDLIKKRMLALVDVITPNWRELAVLTELSVTTEAEASSAAAVLGRLHPRLYVVVTGGDQELPRDLVRLPSGEISWFAGEHIDSTSTHGTGCAFSSALLCRLLAGNSPREAVQAAKDYVTKAIRRAPSIGCGHGPMDLLWPLRPQT